MKSLLIVAGVGVGLYAMLCAFLLFGQSRFVYFPSRPIEFSPSDAGLSFECLSLTAADGVRTAAWFIPREGAALTVLMFHGNGGNIGYCVDTARTFHDMGMNVLMAEYRGYGESDGTPSEEGMHRDSVAAWDHLVREKGISAERIVLYGRSMGGAVACRLAAGKGPAALILESTFTSLKDMAACRFPLFPARVFCRFEYDTLKHIRAVRCPVVCAHSPVDEVVPYEQGRRVFEAASEPKLFLTLSGGHNDRTLDGPNPEYREKVVAFLCVTGASRRNHESMESGSTAAQ